MKEQADNEDVSVLSPTTVTIEYEVYCFSINFPQMLQKTRAYRGGSDGPATPAMAGPLLGPAFRSLTERKNAVLTFARFSGKGRHGLQ